MFYWHLSLKKKITYLFIAGSLLLFSSCSKQRLLLSSCSAQASHCVDFSCCEAWALWGVGSVAVAYGLSCSATCGIFLDQGSNPCLLHWQVDSLPPSHQKPYLHLSIIAPASHPSQLRWPLNSIIRFLKADGKHSGVFASGSEYLAF